MLKVSANCIKLSARFAGNLSTAYEALVQRGDVANVTQLKNGFRVASYGNNRPTATVGVWVDGGSRYETHVNNGVATIFEHIVHTGSSKLNSLQLQHELAKMGAHLKSYTSREHSAFYVECLNEDVEKVVGILADVMFDTKLEARKLEEQRANAIKRLEDYETTNHRGVVMDNLHMTAYQGTPLSYSPLGTIKSLKNLTIESVKEFINDIYKPCRMVLTCVGGGFDHDNLHKMAEKYFGSLGNGYDQKIPLNVSPISHAEHDYIPHIGTRFTGSEFFYRDDNYQNLYGAFAVEGVHRSHIDYLALEVAKTYVGSWNRSYGASLNAPSSLVQKLSPKTEVTAFDSFNLSYDNTGLFGIYIQFKGDLQVPGEATTSAIQKAWKHLAVGVTDDEIDRSKNALKTNLLAALESDTQIANYYATEVLNTGKITPLHQLERKIHFVNASAVREAVSRHIYDREIAIAAIGRTEAWPSYYVLRYGMSWWRL